MLKRFLLVLLVACGDNDPTQPPTGNGTRVRFAIDGVTCQGSGVLLMFVDGVQVGSESLAAGQASAWHSVTPGYHDLGARMQDNSFTWPTERELFTPGADVTHSLECD